MYSLGFFALVEKVNQSKQDHEKRESVFLSEIIWDRYGSDDLHDFLLRDL